MSAKTAATAQSRTADKFVLRLPNGMRKLVNTVAKDNLRSMNSEIIARVHKTLLEDYPAMTLEYDAEVKAFEPVVKVDPWTPLPGMLVCWASDVAQDQPMQLAEVFVKEQPDKALKAVGNIRHANGSVSSYVLLTKLRPYLVK